MTAFIRSAGFPKIIPILGTYLKILLLLNNNRNCEFFQI